MLQQIAQHWRISSQDFAAGPNDEITLGDPQRNQLPTPLP
jgi:hypothetical protein